jgi:hypothetical protein
MASQYRRPQLESTLPLKPQILHSVSSFRLIFVSFPSLLSQCWSISNLTHVSQHGVCPLVSSCLDILTSLQQLIIFFSLGLMAHYISLHFMSYLQSVLYQIPHKQLNVPENVYIFFSSFNLYLGGGEWSS